VYSRAGLWLGPVDENEMNDARAKFALSASWLVLSCAILRFISSFERHVAFQLDARGLVIGCSTTIVGALVMVRPIRNVRKQRAGDGRP
jgi:hypothetical protein